MSNLHRENLRANYKFVSFIIEVVVTCSNTVVEKHTDLIVQPQAHGFLQKATASRNVLTTQHFLNKLEHKTFLPI